MFNNIIRRSAWLSSSSSSSSSSPYPTTKNKYITNKNNNNNNNNKFSSYLTTAPIVLSNYNNINNNINNRNDYLGRNGYLNNTIRSSLTWSFRSITTQSSSSSNNSNNNNTSSTSILQSILDSIKEKECSLSKPEQERLIQYEKDLKLNESLSDFHLGTFYSQGIVVPRDAEKALYWFKRAADRDLAEGQYALGMSYLSGSAIGVFRPIFPSIEPNIPDDQQKKNSTVVLGNGWISNVDSADFDYRQWLKEERRRVQEMRESGTLHAAEKKELERKKEGLRWLTLSAIQNYHHAQLTLGLILLQGKYEIEKKVDKGLYWLEKAGNDHIDLNAMHQLGLHYYNEFEHKILNDNLLKKPEEYKTLLDKFYQYFDTASSRGLAESSCWLGMFFLGAEKQPIQKVGFNMLVRAAEQGSARAATMLSLMYREESKEIFHKYLRLAVDMRDPIAMLCIGELYFSGVEKEYPQNYKKALYYFAESASLGNSDAAINQGVMYYNGFGVDVDYESAFYCYQNAYQLNPKNLAAITNLYTMHFEGLGVPKSLDLANFYAKLFEKIKSDNEKEQQTNQMKEKKLWWINGRSWIQFNSQSQFQQ